MSNPEARDSEMLVGKEASGGKLGGHDTKGPGQAQFKGKASPEQVIGKRKPLGRLNKRLILGVAGAIGVVLLILNFLPGERSAKRNNSSENGIYANDAMPQEVKEMALKMPEVSRAAVPATGTSGYQGVTRVGGPFAGYPSATAEGASSSRGSNAEAGSSAGRDYQGMAARDAKIEAETAARRAPMEVATKLTAGLATGASAQTNNTAQRSSSEPISNPTSTPAATLGPQATQNVVGSALLPQASYTPGQIYRDFNDQQSKTSFSQQQAQAIAPNVGRPADPALLPYTIFAGTIIPAALETAINTDLPGDVLATVSENVYDSVSGKNLLIPQGSKLLAQYSSNVSFGQSRVQVAWQRLIRPDGLSLQLANMNGVDPQGMSGNPGYVDQHWWEYAKGIGLMALFSIIDGQLQYSEKTANNQGLSDVANSVTAGIDQVGTQYTANAENIQPTIIVRQGAKVQVFVNSDIIMPPTNQRTVSQKYSISKQEGEKR